jgi:N-acetylglucosamine kinase-like BadF-type ATPase
MRAERVHGSMNFHNRPRDEVLSRFDAVTRSLLGRVKSPKGVRGGYTARQEFRVVLTAPGAAADEDRDWCSELLQDAGFDASSCMIIDDTWAGLVAGLGSLQGTCAFVGNGASVFVGCRGTSGRNHKLDGWGPVIGDRGSATQIGIEAVQAIAREFDAQGSAPPLYRRLSHELPEFEAAGNLQRWFDAVCDGGHWREELAKLAHVVTRIADSTDTDALAVTLVKSAAHALLNTLRLALQRYPEAKSKPLVLQGGLFANSRRFRNIVMTRAADLFSGDIILSRHRPIFGALILALEGDLREPSASAVASARKWISTNPGIGPLFVAGHD